MNWLCPKSRLGGYRTARGSERDKNSTDHNDGAGAMVGDQNAEQIQISA